MIAKTRMTTTKLESAVMVINELMGTPQSSWRPVAGEPSGVVTANIGHYYVRTTIEGVNLRQITHEQGDSLDVFSCGFVSKRELHNRMESYICGLRDGGNKK